ncbi:protein-export membrane protein SecF [Candidatus Woesebacteria bacterium RIFCSPHIGHO2_01_FULL_39_17]|uniref:Protein-export membrane protein SecF n=3 Tax=Candidatus Woeseibacteriota TaxID=1752722 RepID=A0A0G0NFR7_9BACT|nr:MAG: protein-export membrane protein SecF, preprotein translocase subunit SecF [Microgenomates group bacterium GW2011_GWC1_38_12]KKQ93780.1 MAG: SecF protein [Candidatus Woesebacteria bacterium GW2011_GWB1_39_10b]KKR14343.1 MAG: SecF protein [Candidatus Woesebacteria bacterium GW2011_GWA1_39_21b]OGM23600.1 MAG: protein-export membrane protein SecF [Candidatus Woesebacteria bacterium RIFCSPHIGHO2_01_FULL_39_17]OGM64336.1 MAG: protein-export membrane protein SecF [Candidatus Woesebacteria bact
MDWMHYKKLYFAISGVLIIVGVFSLLNWGLTLGVDFKGGTIAEYAFEEDISTEEMSAKLEEVGIDVASIQSTGKMQYILRLAPIDEVEKEKLGTIFEEMTSGVPGEELRFETVGPSIGPELVKKTLYAVVIASGAILLWVAYQFRSIKFGASAILAMFHDTFNLVGLFALFGHFFNAEVDFLFVTAILTTLSFSVHDTIVVYDRIRESQKKHGETLYDLANKAITETMVRSLNNSFTIIFMLVALILLGGSTIKWFAVALFIGTILGTYSSPFVAVPLLVTWDEISKRIKFRK